MNLKYFAILILLSNSGYAMPPATQPAAGTNNAAGVPAASNTAAGATVAVVQRPQSFNKGFVFTSTYLQGKNNATVEDTLEHVPEGTKLTCITSYEYDLKFKGEREVTSLTMTRSKPLGLEQLKQILPVFFCMKEALIIHKFPANTSSFPIGQHHNTQYSYTSKITCSNAISNITTEHSLKKNSDNTSITLKNTYQYSNNTVNHVNTIIADLYACSCLTVEEIETLFLALLKTKAEFVFTTLGHITSVGTASMPDYNITSGEHSNCDKKT